MWLLKISVRWNPFQGQGFRIRYIRAGAPCPSVREWLEADLCVVLGGPVGVGDTESYPYLKTELDLVRMRLEVGSLCWAYASELK